VSYWSDKHVLITGASSGMGLAAAELVASAGAHVSLLARDVGRLEAAGEAVRSRAAHTGQRVSGISCDVSDRAQIERAIGEATTASGPVDVLLACAGFCEPRRFMESTIEDLTRHIEVNLLGTMYAAHAVAPAMVERGSGSHRPRLSRWAVSSASTVMPGTAPRSSGVTGLRRGAAQRVEAAWRGCDACMSPQHGHAGLRS